MKFREILDEGKIKEGDTIRIKDDFQDSEDDGEFEVIEVRGKRLLIQTLNKEIIKKSKIVPTEVVSINHIYKV